MEKMMSTVEMFVNCDGNFICKFLTSQLCKVSGFAEYKPFKILLAINSISLDDFERTDGYTNRHPFTTIFCARVAAKLNKTWKVFCLTFVPEYLVPPPIFSHLIIFVVKLLTEVCRSAHSAPDYKEGNLSLRLDEFNAKNSLK